jgi:hypothetical protein
MQLLIDGKNLEFLLDNFQQKDFIGLLNKAKDEGEYLAEGRYPTGKYSLDLTLKEAEDIQDALAVLLTEKGLGSDGEPNAIGFRIEELIDQFMVV